MNKLAVFLILLTFSSGNIHGQAINLDASGSYQLSDINDSIGRCKSILRKEKDNTEVRAELGAFYIVKDNIDTSTSGFFQKGMDQFLMVVSQQPDNPAVLAYLSNQTVLSQILSKSGRDTLTKFIQFLQLGEEKASQERLRVLTSLENLSGDEAQASETANLLSAPGDDFLKGITSLKNKDYPSAINTFTSLAGKTNDPQAPLAALGLAEAYYKAGQLDKADVIYGDLMFNSDLSGKAGRAGLEEPTSFQWELGYSLAKAGKTIEAYCYIGDKAPEVAIEEALRLNDRGDKQKAIDLLLASMQVPDYNHNFSDDPDDPSETMWAIGVLSLNVDKYRDAVWGFTQAKEMGLKAETKDEIELGISYLALGEYQQAYDVFDSALMNDPSDNNLKDWRVAADFGVNGWDHALSLMDSNPANLDGNTDTRDLTYNLVNGVYKDLDQRDQRAGLNYPRLQQLSVLCELYSHFAPYWGKEVRQAKWEVIWEAINLYRSLPIKPRPPERAVEQEALAEKLINAGNVDYKTIDAAVLATEIAPWWPQARYNLGELLRDNYWTVNLTYLDRLSDRKQMAAQEFIFYLRLAPDGDRSVEARKQLSDWKVQYQ